MSTGTIVTICIIVVFIGITIALYFFGKKAQKKQAELSATLSKLETVWDTFNVYDKNTASSARKHSDE